MIRRVIDIGLIAALSLLAWTAASAANTQSPQVTDPNADSPAGVVYSIPLDSARQDAAPHRHAGTPSGSNRPSGTGGTGGSIGTGGRGSGAAGPTTGSGSAAATAASGSRAASRRTSGGSAGARGGDGGQPVLIPGGQPGSLIHSSDGFGSSPTVPGLTSRASAGLAAVQGDGSSAPALTILLAFVVLSVGAMIGRAARRSHSGSPAGSIDPQ